MKEKIVYWLRWLAVLPGALVLGILATFPLRWLLLLIFARGNNADDLSLLSVAQNFGATVESVEYVIYPAVIAAFFVYSGAKIAPKNNFKTAQVLFGLYLITWFIVLIIALSAGSLFGATISFSARMILVPLGAFLGLLSSREHKGDPDV